MLPRLFTDPLSLGFAQAAVAAAMALAVMWLSRSWSIHVERETVVALVRGIVQVVVVGSVLVVLLRGPIWTSAIVLSVMVGAASATAARRAKGIPGALWASAWGMAIGSGVVILLGAIIGVIDVKVASIVPVGSMIIANGMNAAALALDRFRAEVVAQTGRIEASLALGADPAVSVAPYLQSAMHASMIPRIDNLRTLGIVWIPGLMAGMILSGSDPVYAAIYQFVVLAMIYASGGITSVVALVLIRSRAFSRADQLVLRPSAEGKG